MHPGVIAWWKAHRMACREGSCGRAADYGHHEFGHHECGHGHGHEGRGHGHDDGPAWGWHAGPHGGRGGEDFGPGHFGVRRPLRFLAYKLDLEEGQLAELAAILNELKTERAQTAVDQRRTTSALADAVAADVFDEAKAKASAQERTKSTERVEAAVVAALARIQALLKPEQRSKLAYLLRTGALSM